MMNHPNVVNAGVVQAGDRPTGDVDCRFARWPSVAARPLIRDQPRREMVALRTPAQLPPPEPDGLPTDAVGAEGLRETLLWLGYRLARASLDPKPRSGRPSICLDLDAGSGVLTDLAHRDLSWGASLLALQLLPPDHTYVLHSGSAEQAAALAARANTIKPSGAVVFELALNDSRAYAQARDIASVVVGLGPKIVVTHGDENRVVFAMNELLTGTKRRHVIARAGLRTTVPWRRLARMVDAERSIDFMLSVPPSLQTASGVSGLLGRKSVEPSVTDFFGTEAWFELASSEPRRASWLLRALYVRRLGSKLGLRTADEQRGLSERVLRGRPVFASTNARHAKLWTLAIGQSDWSQDELYLDTA